MRPHAVRSKARGFVNLCFMLLSLSSLTFASASMAVEVSDKAVVLTAGVPKNAGVFRFTLRYRIFNRFVAPVPVTVNVTAGMSDEQKAQAIATAINAAGGVPEYFGYRATRTGASVKIQLTDPSTPIPSTVAPSVSIDEDTTGEEDKIEPQSTSMEPSTWCPGTFRYTIGGVADGISQDYSAPGWLTFGNDVYVAVVGTWPGMTALQALTLMHDDLQSHGVTNVAIESGPDGTASLVYTPTCAPSEFVMTGADDDGMTYSFDMIGGVTVPIASRWGMIALLGALMAGGAARVRRRSRRTGLTVA